ncbi:hypothetical protein M1M24_gp32 [Polaribacter phage Freya_1]|uniref:Holin n=1 Tax=Polaribacter phage Freya_1 TaxID=2745662 RepID=A0A8E4ZJI7_9CAUD|nr:hypothetical protein M1M24_gp32 [Polaribacter phage Freya_1]QQV90969.1 hypothetical protein Freya2_32 [Polaribacter phage Freya_2]QQV91037.1 hypothetical protein Freya3_32 [Polaribacter phage Freya_3]QQV91105.1 hypothetical protein Freya4_32 [Polaribacter phage Freya_4]QQV91180.1 hypothetical protein Freya8_39 [Polaribacter phage Freya_8]QQV91257.1 hypothetical protein Freya9_41 [Polaribacter phage Freya_9]QQV91335.1 hypothetical protein Freya10_42 [Polaribacter phage Freya_10]QYV99914.1 
MTLQIDEVTKLLNKESVTAIGLLLTICALLIWDKVRQEKRYESLLDKYEKEQEDNKTILIDLVQKSILATEKNTQAINTIRDVYRDRT